MKEFYMYIADPKSVKNIMKEGLRADENGVIDLLATHRLTATATLIEYPFTQNETEYEVKTTVLICDDTARKKGLKKYTLLRISRDGIKTEPMPATGKALFSEYVWKIKQPLIEPRYITVMGSFHTMQTIANEIRRKGETDWFLMD